MRVTKEYCDKCETEIQASEKFRTVKLELVFPSTTHRSHIDLCGDCHKSFEQWFGKHVISKEPLK